MLWFFCASDKKAAYDAVEKHSSQLVSLLSAEVVGLHDFGEELVAAKFMNESSLNDIMDRVSTSENASKLSFVVSTQVQHYPEKYFKAYLTILEKFPPLCLLLKKIKGEYYGMCIIIMFVWMFAFISIF